LKRKIGIFEPDKGFFEPNSRSYLARKRQNMAKKPFYSQLEKAR